MTQRNCPQFSSTSSVAFGSLEGPPVEGSGAASGQTVCNQKEHLITRRLHHTPGPRGDSRPVLVPQGPSEPQSGRSWPSALTHSGCVHTNQSCPQKMQIEDRRPHYDLISLRFPRVWCSPQARLPPKSWQSSTYRWGFGGSERLKISPKVTQSAGWGGAGPGFEPRPSGQSPHL